MDLWGKDPSSARAAGRGSGTHFPVPVSLTLLRTFPAIDEVLTAKAPRSAAEKTKCVHTQNSVEANSFAL